MIKYIGELAICIAFGLLTLSGCTGADQPATNNTTTTTNRSTPTTGNGNSTTPTTSTTTNNSNTTTASGNRTGVADCDDFLERYEACLQSNVPEAQRAALRTSVDSMRTSWRSAAQTPQGRAGLEQACRQARDAARQQMTAYNCSF